MKTIILYFFFFFAGIPFVFAQHPNNKTVVMCQHNRTHIFSNAAIPDSFFITAYGNGMEIKNIIIVIKNKAQKLIWKDEITIENFTIEWGQSYYEEWNGLSVAEKQKFIGKVLEDMLNDKNFSAPAAEIETTTNSNKAIIAEMKNKQQPLCWHIVRGFRDVRNIAWSNKQKKVVMLYSCCNH